MDENTLNQAPPIPDDTIDTTAEVVTSKTALDDDLDPEEILKEMGRGQDHGFGDQLVQRDHSQIPGKRKTLDGKEMPEYKPPTQDQLDKGPSFRPNLFKKVQGDGFEVPPPPPKEPKPLEQQQQDLDAELGGDGYYDDSDLIGDFKTSDPQSELKNRLSDLITDGVWRKLTPWVMEAYTKIPEDFIETYIENEEALPLDIRAKLLKKTEQVNKTIEKNSKIKEEVIVEWGESLAEIMQKHNADVEIGPEGRFIYATAQIGAGLHWSYKENKKVQRQTMTEIKNLLDEFIHKVEKEKKRNKN